MLDAQQFRKLMYTLFCAFPTSLKDGHVSPQVQNAYWEVLKDRHPDDLKKAVIYLAGRGGTFVPSASVVFTQCKKYAIDRVPSAYHNEYPAVETTAQLPAFSGDGMPSCSRDIPVPEGRRAQEYSISAHDTTDHLLDLIRAMKFKHLAGEEMARRVIDQMGEQGPRRSNYAPEWKNRLAYGQIPKAHDQNSLDFATYLDKVAAKEVSPKEDPLDIGGRRFITFSPKQQDHIRRRIREVAQQSSQVEQGQEHISASPIPQTTQTPQTLPQPVTIPSAHQNPFFGLTHPGGRPKRSATQGHHQVEDQDEQRNAPSGEGGNDGNVGGNRNGQ